MPEKYKLKYGGGCLMWILLVIVVTAALIIGMVIAKNNY
jgi:hypothetical protein